MIVNIQNTMKNVNLLIRFLTVSNLFTLEVVQKCQRCQLCVLREKSIVQNKSQKALLKRNYQSVKYGIAFFTQLPARNDVLTCKMTS